MDNDSLCSTRSVKDSHAEYKAKRGMNIDHLMSVVIAGNRA